MSDLERNYMCRQFCEPDGVPTVCLLLSTIFSLSDAGDVLGGPTTDMTAAANRIADVCQVVARELSIVDEFRT